MKSKVLFLAAIMTLVACNTNEPSDSSKGNKFPYNIIFKGKSLYLDWFFSDMESFVSYVSHVNPQDKELQYNESVRGTEDNTITLKNGMKIRLHDDYKLNNEGNQTTLQLTRTVARVNENTNNTPHRNRADGDNGNITHTYSYSIQSAMPIQIIRPAVDSCNPLPLCYYEDLEIEWNADLQNANGVVVIADWMGSTLYSPSQRTRVVNVDIVEDTGEAVLSTGLFDNMPDEALVDLWLIRGNLITINGEGEISLADALQNSPEQIEELLETYPELCIQLQPYMFGTGAVVRLPFALIRNL